MQDMHSNVFAGILPIIFHIARPMEFFCIQAVAPVVLYPSMVQ